MKLAIGLVLFFSMNAFAYNPMGAHFLNPKTNEKIVLTCATDETVQNCTEAYLTLVDGDELEVLHDYTAIPMDDSDESFKLRYGLFYLLRDRLMEARSVGPQAWIFYNNLKITKNFNEAVKTMFSKDPAHFDQPIKMTKGNFKALVEVIKDTL